MDSKNSLLITILLVLLAGLIFTGVFYLVQKPKIDNYLFKESTGGTTGTTTEEIFDPSRLSWQEATSNAAWTKRDSHAAVVFNGKMWVMGGLNGNGTVLAPGVVEYWKAAYFSDIWNSENGKDWNLVEVSAPWGQRRSIQIVVFKGKLWLMGGWGPEIGYRSDIWTSTDGINWELATSAAAWPVREGHSLAVFQNKLWLIGGVNYNLGETKNDVWYSEDGINWKLATSAAQWTPRWDHAVTVFENKLWLLGGMDLNDKIYNDVWYSGDGINWTLATANPPWQKRQGMNIVTYHDRMWIIGRFNDVLNQGPNDVWYSEDGIGWQKTQTDPGWLGREDSTAVVFKDKIWIMGGMDSQWEWTNDVWYSTSTSI